MNFFNSTMSPQEVANFSNEIGFTSANHTHQPFGDLNHPDIDQVVSVYNTDTVGPVSFRVPLPVNFNGAVGCQLMCIGLPTGVLPANGTLLILECPQIASKIRVGRASFHNNIQEVNIGVQPVSSAFSLVGWIDGNPPHKFGKVVSFDNLDFIVTDEDHNTVVLGAGDRCSISLKWFVHHREI